MIFEKKCVLFLCCLLLFVFATLPDAANAVVPAESQALLPLEIDQAYHQIRKANERSQEFGSELEGLKAHLEEGNQELRKEGEKVSIFLEIEEISSEEFMPYLDQWRVMCGAYADVLGNLEDQTEELGQMRISLESKVRLWKLKTNEQKLNLPAGSKQKAPADILKSVQEHESVFEAYENSHEKAAKLLREMSKTKAQLGEASSICKQNLQALENRWEKIRFSYLKLRQQPKFSGEYFSLAWHELEFRLKDSGHYSAQIKNYISTIVEVFERQPIQAASVLLGIGFLMFAFSMLRKIKLLKNLKIKPGFRVFGALFLTRLSKEIWLFGPVLMLSAFLFLFPTTRSSLGFFILFGLLGFVLLRYVLFFVRGCVSGVDGQEALLSPLKAHASALLFRIRLFLGTGYLFVLLMLFEDLFKDPSEITRLLKWLFEVLLFGFLFSILSPRFFIDLVRPQKQHLLGGLLRLTRYSVLGILIAVIALDGAGYTYFSDYLADSSLKSLLWLPIFLVLRKGVNDWSHNTILTHFSPLKIRPELIASLLRTLGRWIKLLSLVLFVFGIAVIWDVKQPLKRAIGWLWNLGFSLGSVEISVGLVLSVCFTLYLSILVSRLIRTLLERNLYPRQGWDTGIRNAVSTGVHYLTVLIGLIIALKLLGFDIRNITVLAGAFGIGLGFGLQNLANNFASGIVLLIERPIRIGDIIEIGSIVGRVKKIGARSTMLEVIDQSTLIVPNGEILSSKLTNWTYSNAVARLSIPVGVAYGSDVSEVEELLEKIAKEHPDIVSDPKPIVEFKAFGPFSLDFVLHVWICDIRLKLLIQNALMFQIEKTLRERQISIPYPKQEVLIKSQ